MAADWITQGISSTGLISVIPSQKLEAIANIHGNMEAIQALAKTTTARTIITGVFYKEGENIQFHANIVDAGSHEILNALEPVNSPASDPLKAIEQLRQNILGALAANFDPAFRHYSVHTLNPPMFDAYKEFLFGVDLFFDYQYEEAIDHFSKAVSKDSTYFTPYLWMGISRYNLARRYSYRNDIPNSNAEFEKFYSLLDFLDKQRDRLTVGEQYILDWLIALGKGDWTASLKATMNAAPYSLVFAYEIGWDGIMANRPGVVIEELLKLKPDLLHFPGSYWENITLAYHMLGNYQKEIEMARKGREKYPESLYLLYYEMRALAALGKMEIINQRLNESFAMPQDDDMHSGWLMLYTSRELRAHGYFNEATGMAERCVEWCKLNHPADETEVIGSAYYVAEKWDKAQENFEWLLNAYPEDFSTWGNLGVIAARKGDTLEVERISKHITEMKRPYLFGKDLYWLTKIAAVSGEKEKAVQLYREAINNGLDIYYNEFILPGESMDFESLRDYPPFQELIRPKG